ncbi:hypothetical protein NMG60_11016824 [Bertholletia excelsa]
MTISDPEPHHGRPHSGEGDGCFDIVPDPLVLQILNYISDVKTLIWCRAVSKRFNSLVPQADTLLLRVDRVVSATEPDDDDSFIVTFLRSIFKPIYDLVSPKPLPDPARMHKSPAEILRGFEKIRQLEIELPAGDLRLEKGAVIRWRAEFGKTLRSCVILGCRSAGAGAGDSDLGGGGLKMRVVWTISALIAASARHYVLKDVVREHEELDRLVVRDREEEGTVVMERDGLRECREGIGEDETAPEEIASEGGSWGRNNRTTVPAVRMRMMHEQRLKLAGGEVVMEGATLVVVQPAASCSGAETEAEEQRGDASLAQGAFGGVYGEAVEKLLKSRSYILEMNSF